MPTSWRALPRPRLWPASATVPARPRRTRSGPGCSLASAGSARPRRCSISRSARRVRSDDRRRVTAVLGAAPGRRALRPEPGGAGRRSLPRRRAAVADHDRIALGRGDVDAVPGSARSVARPVRRVPFDACLGPGGAGGVGHHSRPARDRPVRRDGRGHRGRLGRGGGAAALCLRGARRARGRVPTPARRARCSRQALLEQGHIDEADLLARRERGGGRPEPEDGDRLARGPRSTCTRRAATPMRASTLAEEAVGIAAATDLVLDHADACVALADLRDAAGDAVGAGAARAEALRLYEAKGATVPAERISSTRPRGSRLPSAVPVRAPGPVAPGPQRRRSDGIGRERRDPVPGTAPGGAQRRGL